MSHNTPFNYKFIQEEFIQDGQRYKVVLTPELYSEEEEELDFTGDYLGILISEGFGTYAFKLTENEETKWEMIALTTVNTQITEELQIDPNLIIDETGEIEALSRPPAGSFHSGIIDELDRIIQKSLNGAQ